MKRNKLGQFIGKGRDSGRWKGGRVNYKGYIRLFKPNHPYGNLGFILEHRLKMEEKLGRIENRRGCSSYESYKKR